MIKKFFLIYVLFLFVAVGSTNAQGTFTKWKIVEDPATLETNDVVVVVDLTTSNAMTNNPAYEGGNTVSKESPSAAKVTLKEELDRISSEVADTIVWTMNRPDDSKYSLYFLNEESKTRYLFNSDQNLRVGFVSEDNASKRKFDIDNGLFHMKIQTDEDVYSDYHIGVKVASGIMAMMSGSTWELMKDTLINGSYEIHPNIKATKMYFFKKVETSLPDPTITFPKHDYEADVHAGANSFEAPVATVAEDANAAITYYSGNTDLAEVDATTGAVTLKKRGTVRIYAHVAATATYDDYLTSYVLRIDDSEAAGGRNNPFTVAQAIEYAKAEGHEEETANGVCYFVKGIVSSVGGAMAGMEGMEDMMEMMSGMMEDMEDFDMSTMMSMFMGEQEPGTVTYAISDNGVDRDSLSIINGRGLQLVDITEDSLSVGDEVTVYGPLEYSEDNDMMSMFGGMGGNGGDNEDKRTVKMPRVNYMQEHERNLITEDIVLYYGKTKTPDDLYSITKLFGGTQIINETTLKPSDTEVANWVVNSEKTDSLLTPKKEGIIKVTVYAPVMLQPGDTIKMKRSFTLDVRSRDLPAAGSMVGDYQLVTATTPLQPGDKLIIVATVNDKSKVLCRGSGSSGGMMAMFGGGSNAKDVTIGGDGRISEIPDATQILTLEQDGDLWRLQTGMAANGQMTYLYISDTDGGSGGMSIPGMGSNGATLTTGYYSEIGDSCQVTFNFPEAKNDSVKIQFNFADREKDGNTVKAKNIIRYGKGTMSSSFAGFEEGTTDEANLPRLYRLVRADQYDVTISDALWATIVSTYDVALPENLKGYIVTAVDDTKAFLYEVTSLQGGKPYLLKGESKGSYTLTRSTEVMPMPTENLLRVSDSTTGNGVYVLANGNDGPGFYKWTGGTLGAGRVHLPADSQASYLLFDINGETTNVISIDNGKLMMENDAWYDLQGRCISVPSVSSASSVLPKGVYIHNGKKVVIK